MIYLTHIVCSPYGAHSECFWNCLIFFWHFELKKIVWTIFGSHCFFLNLDRTKYLWTRFHFENFWALHGQNFILKIFQFFDFWKFTYFSDCRDVVQRRRTSHFLNIWYYDSMSYYWKVEHVFMNIISHHWVNQIMHMRVICTLKSSYIILCQFCDNVNLSIVWHHKKLLVFVKPCSQALLHDNDIFWSIYSWCYVLSHILTFQ